MLGYELVMMISASVIGIALIFIAILGVIAVHGGNRRNNAKLAVGADFEEVSSAADATLDEINKVSQQVLREIDEKYQEFLFLYNLLDEKKKEIAHLSERTQAAAPVSTPRTALKPVQAGRSLRATGSGNNSRYNKVKELYKDGMSVADIAKKLDIGQGEVSLILSLGKR